MKEKKWLVEVFILSFVLSAIFSGVSSLVSDLNIILLLIILCIVIGIGILFDMIGVATITCKEAPFHAMNAKKVKGAKESLKLLKNSNKVSSVCNDVIGDICGIISGSLSAVITVYLTTTGLNPFLATILITSITSSLTVGGKAYFKTIAMKNCESILFRVGKILCIKK